MTGGVFDGEKYLSLETYRKAGQGVRTAVWFAAGADAGSPLYVYTLASSGKAKRIRRDGRVRIAPCDARGKVTGVWTDARATIVDGEEARLGMRLLDQKYWPWKRLLDLSVLLLRRHDRIVLAIRMV
jgi:PPOX class probable F420-dependent enzyme